MTSGGGRPSAVERAYQLARTGECATPLHIRQRLAVEGYTDARTQISGKALVAELNRRCRETRGELRLRGAVAAQRGGREME